MGYYSSVALALDKQGKTALKESIKALPKTEASKSIRQFFRLADYHRTAKGAEVFWWRDIKWYVGDEHFAHVSFLAKFLKSLDLEHYRFLRIGEYADDTEEEGGFVEHCPFRMELVRELDVE